MISYFIEVAVLIWLFMTFAFLICSFKKNNGLVDIAWGAGFFLVTAFTFLKQPDAFQSEMRSRFMIFCFVTLWALRLSIYLFMRNWNAAEDWRYAAWRNDWGKNFYWRSYLQVFLLQGVLMFIILLPVTLANVSGSDHEMVLGLPAWLFVIPGTLLFAVGFFFEAVGDYQLQQFKANPANKGKVMQYGLWAYTRHPNYFGESCIWWGIFLLSLLSAHGRYDMLIRFIGPSLITLLLLRVSGVTMLEKKYSNNPEYEAYKKRVNAFLPWIKR